MPQCVLSAAVAATLTLGITLALLVGATLALLSEGDDPRAALALPRTFFRRGTAPATAPGRGTPMTWGTITTLRHDRGYGFIAPDDRGHHLFFHRGAVAGGGF